MLSKLKYWIKKRFPRWQAQRLYKSNMGRNINWSRPSEFNEKIRWIQFNSNTSKWSLLADKYLVRKYLERHNKHDMLVKLYGVWDNVQDIDFESLPKSFVLKTTHGSASVYIVRDKDKEDLEAIRQQLARDLSVEFGVESAEPHYLEIVPRVIAEELLVQDGTISSSIIDYKFYCIYGMPQFCGVMYNRNPHTHDYEVKLYDCEWNDISEMLAKGAHVGKLGIPRPEKLTEMIDFCKEMCKDFPFVRLDLYECNGHVYFGEFTFTPAACSGGSLGVKANELLSSKLSLPI